jgi:hypothetical protein
MVITVFQSKRFDDDNDGIWSITDEQDCAPGFQT